MTYVQRSIQSLFHSDLLGFYSVLDLVEFAVISDGEIIPQRTLLSNAENLLKLPLGQRGLVYIDVRSRLYLKFPVERRQIRLQEFICLLDAVNPGKPHLFDQTILERSKQSLYPAFGLRRVGMDDRYPEFGKTPFELAHGFFIFQLILDALLGRGFIGCVLVQINALGNAVTLDIPIEAVHGRHTVPS